MGRPAAKDRPAYDVETLTTIAVQVFNERGYDGTSMDDIARAAGITKGSLYHHVKGKEEFLTRGAGRALQALHAVLDEPQAQQGTALARLKHILARAVAVEIRWLPEVSLLLRLRGNTPAEQALMAQRRHFDQVFTALVRAGIAEGSLRADLDPRLVTRLILGMANWLVEWYRPQGALAPEQIADGILKLAFEGLER